MRKDAKIGFAIGGVLLAVLTAYVIVVPRHSHTVAHNGAAVSPPTQTLPDQSNPPATPVASGAPVTPSVAASDTSNPTRPDRVTNGDNINWEKLLSGASGSPLLSATPHGNNGTPGDGHETPGATVVDRTPIDPAPAAGALVDPAPVSSLPPVMSHPAPAVDPTPVSPAVAAAHTYVVKQGQTLSSIASEVYGNQRFYVAILRANPTLNPSRLHAGQKITLPAVEDVKPELARDIEPATPAPTTSANTYTVVAGDSLFHIANKLYGSPRQADAIYQLNKESIGADKARLRLGMVLNLPEAPTATASAR